MQKNGKWKIVGIIGVIVAIASLFVTVFIYLETTRPHSRSEQIKEKLDTTEKRWHEAKKLVEEEENRGENVVRFKEMLREARELYLNAENKWMHEDYDGAQILVEESYEIISSVLEQIKVEVKIPLFVLLILMVTTLILFYAIAVLRRRKTWLAEPRSVNQAPAPDFLP